MLRSNLEVARGGFRSALGKYRRVLSLQERLLGPSHPQVAAARAGLASPLIGLGELPAALDEALKAEAVGREHLRVTSRHLAERQALSYAAKRPRGLDLALSILMASGSRTGNDVERVLAAVIQSRALVLDEIAARRRVAVDVRQPELAARVAALTEARQRLANLVVRGTDASPGARYAHLLEDARRKKEEAERELAEKSTVFRNELMRAQVSLSQVHAALPEKTALVSIVMFDRFTVGSRSLQAGHGKWYAAFVLRGDRPRPSVVSIGSGPDIDRLVAAWRTEIAGGTLREDRSEAEGETTYRLVGRTLRERVWDPIAHRLEGIGRVFIVPDGALHLVSVASLPVGSNGYLVERLPVVHYLSAERDVVRPDSPSTAGRGILAVGAPAFDEDASRSSAVQEQVLAGSIGHEASGRSFRGRRAACGGFDTLNFQPLPRSGEEATEVAALWRRRLSSDDQLGGASVTTARVLFGLQATEEAFKQAAPGRRVLHLATHGFFLGAGCIAGADGTRSVGGLAFDVTGGSRTESLDNPLLLSGLALAGANRRAEIGPGEEDGILTAEEVAALNLDGVEWVVLSACDTGLGQVSVGEGVFGLRRAFEVAGARTVIMSLWSVDDEEAREWMGLLYGGKWIRGLDTATAIRQASLAVLQARRAGGLSTHPFHWAGFVAAGDWR